MASAVSALRNAFMPLAFAGWVHPCVARCWRCWWIGWMQAWLSTTSGPPTPWRASSLLAATGRSCAACSMCVVARAVGGIAWLHGVVAIAASPCRSCGCSPTAASVAPPAGVMQGVNVHGERLVLQRASGDVSHVQVWSAPVRNAAGDIIAGVVFTDDITGELAVSHRRRPAFSCCVVA